MTTMFNFLHRPQPDKLDDMLKELTLVCCSWTTRDMWESGGGIWWWEFSFNQSHGNESNGQVQYVISICSGMMDSLESGRENFFGDTPIEAVQKALVNNNLSKV